MASEGSDCASLFELINDSKQIKNLIKKKEVEECMKSNQLLISIK